MNTITNIPENTMQHYNSLKYITTHSDLYTNPNSYPFMQEHLNAIDINEPIYYTDSNYWENISNWQEDRNTIDINAPIYYFDSTYIDPYWESIWYSNLHNFIDINAPMLYYTDSNNIVNTTSNISMSSNFVYNIPTNNVTR